MPESIDAFLPATSFTLPGGDVFKVGTMWDQDTVRQLILFQYIAAGAKEPIVEFAVSPKSADMIISSLQERANEARYISGLPMVDYGTSGKKVALGRPPKKRRSTPPV